MNKLYKKWIMYIMVAVLLLEVYFLVCINLFPETSFIDQDYAKIVRHFIEVCNRRNLLLSHWDYLTTGEFDCASLLAIAFYQFTGDIYLSFGISNLINVFIWGGVIFFLLREIGIDLFYRLLAISLIILPYDLGMLSYTNMMFFAGGQYVYKTLVPVLFVLAIVISYREKMSFLMIATSTLLLFLTFLTAFSSGIYVFVCGLLPVLICTCYISFTQKEKNGLVYRAIISVVVVIMSIVGTVVCKLAKIDPNSSSMVIRDTHEYVDVAMGVVNDFIKVFNPFMEKQVMAVSYDCIAISGQWFLLAFFGIGIVSISRSFRGIFSNDGAKKQFVLTALSFIFVLNSFVVFMTVSTPRYHLIGVIPLIIISVIALEGKQSKGYGKHIFNTLIVFCIAVVTLGAIRTNAKEWFNNYYGGYLDYPISMETCDELIKYFKEKDVGTVFFVDNSELPELMRAMDTSRQYETYVSHDGSVVNYDYYYSERDKSAYSARNIVVVQREEIEGLPEYITSNYERVMDVGEYMLLFSTENPIDGVCLVDRDLTTIDMATTPGYKYEGQIDNKGWLHTDSVGLVLESAMIKADNPLQISVNYSIESVGTSIKLLEWSDEGFREIESYLVDPRQNTLNIEVKKASKYALKVIKPNDSKMIIKEIEFIHKSNDA